MEDIFATYGYLASGGEDFLSDCGYTGGGGGIGDGWTMLPGGPGEIEEIVSDWWNVLQDDLKVFLK